MKTNSATNTTRFAITLIFFALITAALTGCLNTPPNADFTAEPITGAAPLTVQFTDQSTPGSAAISLWSWDFGDGFTSAEQDPVHTYTAAGTYNVSLTVTTANGENTELKLNFISVTPSGEGEGEGEGEVPNVSWGTYLGGADDDAGSDIVVDSSGNVYATGGTSSPGWVSNGWDTSFGGGVNYGDGYVVKLDASGAHLWSTYLGGADHDIGRGIAVDASGNVYVTGYTWSSGWVSNGWDTSYNGNFNSDLNSGDGYVVKLDTSGAHLWSTYLGGGGSDIVVDSSGNVYATGGTSSPGWVSNGWDTSFGGYADGYVVKLDTAGVHMWSTYVGGANYEGGSGIAVDSSGNVYVTGGTHSSGWVSNGWDTSYNGGQDSYVVKLNTSGAHLWSTYLGGTSYDGGWVIAVDSSGNVYAAGTTSSSGWVSNGWDTSYNGGYDGYVVKLNASGAHLWSTYMGGTDDDYGYGIAADSSRNVYVTGGTYSPGWISNGWDTDGGQDGFVLKIIDPTSAL